MTGGAGAATGRTEFRVRLDREGATWLAEEAEALFAKTKDHGWDEIARDLRQQLSAKEDDDA